MLRQLPRASISDTPQRDSLNTSQSSQLIGARVRPGVDVGVDATGVHVGVESFLNYECRGTRSWDR